MQSFAIAAAVACCLAAVSQAASNVDYTANGTFATPARQGNDGLLLAGQAFNLSIVVNEATKPVKGSKTTAQYVNLPLTGTVNSGLLPGQPIPIPPGTVAKLSLQVAPVGSPDVLTFSFAENVLGLPITFSGKVYLPNGTITTPAIRPFTKAVTLNSKSGMLTYSCMGTSCGTYTSTTLGFASGTVNAVLQ